MLLKDNGAAPIEGAAPLLAFIQFELYRTPCTPTNSN